MISHKHKCIFIHVPRTGGTSIEWALEGKSVFNETPSEKHLTASASMEMYKEYWDSYFKFSFVRNPWDRVVSMYHIHWYENINILSGKSLKSFLESYKPFGHEPDPCTLVNIIDQPLDFIGRFENLEFDFEFICSVLDVGELELPHCTQTKHEHYTRYYNDETRDMVADIYGEDIEYYGYEYDD